MASPLDRVRPGDLITAQSINSILDKLQELDTRVGKLEGPGTPTGKQVLITGILPPGPQRVGEVLEIVGQNFDFSVKPPRVFLDSTPAEKFIKEKCSDTQLLVEIPFVPGVTEAGTPVTLTVANQTTIATGSLTLKPQQQPQQANVYLTYLGESPQTPAPGQPFSVNYQVQSQALLTAVVTLSGSVTPIDWQNQVQVLDGNGNPIPDGSIKLNPGQSQNFSIRIAQIPSYTAENTSFGLTTNATSPGMAGAHDTQSYIVTSEVKLQSISADPGQAMIGNDTINLARGTSVKVRLEATYKVVGTYDLSLALQPPTTNWSAELAPSSTPIKIEQVPNIQHHEFTVYAYGNSSNKGEMIFTVKRQGESSKTSKAFTLPFHLLCYPEYPS